MSGDHDDFATEPVPGLPALPPDGETILWQGAPDWRLLAVQVFHVRAAAVYFLALVLWRADTVWLASGEWRHAMASVLGLLPIAGLCLGLLFLLAWGYGRSTLFTITNRRVVIRSGLALTVAVNLPFSLLRSVDVKPLADGSGTIRLRLSGPERLKYSVLWPFVRPFRLAEPEPMLRGIHDVGSVARLLSDALGRSFPEARRQALPQAKHPVSSGVTGRLEPTAG